MKTTPFRQQLRIILAITAKDTLDALKNRTLLTLAFSILVLMLSARALPMLLSWRGLPALGIYDPAGLPVLEPLQDRDDLRFVRFDFEQEMKSQLLDTPELMIGLVLPDETKFIAGEDQIYLDGYYPNWANPARVHKQVAFLEDVLSDTFGTEVQIEVDGNAVYPTVEPGLHLLMITQATTLMIFLVGSMMVPYLFLDEKEQRTMDALLVSPASYGQLVSGKALAGVVYCLVTAAVVLLFNFRYIVHWELVLLAILLGGAFSVLIGLLLGILVESQASLGMWTGLLLVFLVGPSFISSFSQSRLPVSLKAIFSWTPGVAFNQLLKASMYQPIQAASILRDAVILAAAAALIFILILWRADRLDR